MGKETPIILGIIFTIVAIFIIVSGAPVQIRDLTGDVTITGNLNVTGSGEFGDDIDMNQHYLLNSPQLFEYLSSLTPGRTDVEIAHTASGVFTHDIYYSFGMLHVDIAPGDGKWVNISISNGVDSLSFSITGDDTSDTDMTGFLWDVSAQPFVIQYTQSAGGSSLAAYIHGERWYVATP